MKSQGSGSRYCAASKGGRRQGKGGKRENREAPSTTSRRMSIPRGSEK